MLDGRTCADSLWVVHYYSNPLAEFGCFGTLSDQQKLQQDPHGIRQLWSFHGFGESSMIHWESWPSFEAGASGKKWKGKAMGLMWIQWCLKIPNRRMDQVWKCRRKEARRYWWLVYYWNSELGTCCHGFNDNLLTNLFLFTVTVTAYLRWQGYLCLSKWGGVSKHSLFHIVSDVFLCNFPAGSSFLGLSADIPWDLGYCSCLTIFGVETDLSLCFWCNHYLCLCRFLPGSCIRFQAWGSSRPSEGETLRWLLVCLGLHKRLQ